MRPISPLQVHHRGRNKPYTNPCRVIFNLVGKAYGAAAQVGAFLHIMGVLQAYQEDLLKELDHSVGLGPEVVQELSWVTVLAVRMIK